MMEGSQQPWEPLELRNSVLFSQDPLDRHSSIAVIFNIVRISYLVSFSGYSERNLIRCRGKKFILIGHNIRIR